MSPDNTAPKTQIDIASGDEHDSPAVSLSDRAASSVSFAHEVLLEHDETVDPPTLDDGDMMYASNPPTQAQQHSSRQVLRVETHFATPSKTAQTMTTKIMPMNSCMLDSFLSSYLSGGVRQSKACATATAPK